MVSYNLESLVDFIKQTFNQNKIILLAPVVKSRKGNYQELFQQIIKKGYTQCRIDGKIMDINNDTSLERYKNHDIEIVIDKLYYFYYRDACYDEQLVIQSICMDELNISENNYGSFICIY